MTFNKTIATIMGNAESATILDNIYFWVDKNKANEKHFYDGKHWTYNSAKAFSKQFPWLSEKQIRTHIQKLEEKGFIETGNYNKMAYDRTKWYTVTEKAIAILEASNLPVGNMEIPQREHSNSPEVTPIPDINTDINTDIKTANNKPLKIISVIDTQKDTTTKDITTQKETSKSHDKVMQEEKRREQKRTEEKREETPDKPAKPQKHKHGEYKHVLLTSDEYLRLCEEWGEPELLRMIKELDEGIEMKGYKYKNHNLALRKWKSNEKTQRNGYSKPLPVQTRTAFLDMED